ncbi:heparan-alpha-glucosaminide N-acetyltransferase-like [Arachis ipaensis]|uniref:heparan-alpha-glucosaminide N-acetyltransferase-like n=1 Tax=Arachis ipaensis TaxID=130454 RepID=UPI000A2B63A4|nr:heparan-alpha-glucosaminide N-acetyltransferase-like [Arachis ipaensis]
MMENSGYERVRNYDECDENEERMHLNPINRTKKDAKENGDVEMANLQVSESRRGIIFSNAKDNNNNKNDRLVSLDIFRGLTVTLMVFVDHAGRLFPGINHSPWNGLTLADFVMPFFLFIVGVSLALTYKRLSSGIIATRKAILRALKLLSIGVFLQVRVVKWRIAIAYLVAALCEIWLKCNDSVNSVLSLLRKYRYQGYIVKCGVRGDTGPACNAVGMIDRKILGIQHLYKKPIYARKHECSINSPNYGPLPPNAPSWCQAPFDPEGFLSSLMAVVTCFVGLHYGHIIIHFKDHRVRIFQWMSLTCFLVILGLILDIIGKHIILLLSCFYFVDVCGYRYKISFLEWMGKNALLIYIIATCNLIPVVLQGFYWGEPRNNIFKLIGIGR